MNALTFYQNFKWKLAKFIVIIFLGLNPSILTFSNPILPGPCILEIYFGPEGWQIEMMNVNAGVDNLDNVWMMSDDDAAHFNPGIAFNPWEVIVVTQADFMTELDINQAGDWLVLSYINGEQYESIDYYGLAWGTAPPDCDLNEVTAPVGEESIAFQRFEGTYVDDYWAVKELPNTIGFSPFEVSKRANFRGYVRDMNDEPLANVWFDYSYTNYWPYIYTDTNGYFTAYGDMFCRIFDIDFIFNGGKIGDTTVTVEPDSVNYFEFKLDTLLTSINEIQSSTLQYSIFNIPNPSSSQTKFIIETFDPKPDQKGVIKIYSESGYIVDIIPVELMDGKQELNYNFKYKSLAPGVYIYNLETGHQKVTSGKMIVTQ